MKHRIIGAAALACAALLLGACGSVNVKPWPFGGGKEHDPSRTPAGATAYACDSAKWLFVRYLDNGAAAWVILPDREFRLNKVASTSGTRYSNGNTTLEVKEGAATLAEGAAVTHAGCKGAAS